ncbi:MAG: alpha/beta fold hydrolase [Candidatus Hodarchaeales archaeon]|jgi:pimeloyl-ACP methyl ester carboxylesterase
MLNNIHKQYVKRSEEFHKGFDINSDETFKESLKHQMYHFFYNYNEEIEKDILNKFSKTIYSLRTLNREESVLRKDYNVIDCLKDIKIPTLILNGKFDLICPLSQAELMYQEIKGSKMVIFENSGHFPNIEEPEKFIQTIFDWSKSFN